MNWFKHFTIPLLLVCWSTCIVLSIVDIYYIKNIDKKWIIYDNELLESKNWWICGIPLCIYSLIIELCLLITTIFCYKKDLIVDEINEEDNVKEFRNYNSNYTYSNLYDNVDEYKSSILNWIDRVGVWNRLVFIITNFITIMTFYYLFVGLYEYKTRSITFLLKCGIIIFGFILTWIPGILNSYKECLKLFSIILISSILLIILMFLRNYQNNNKVMELTSEILNIKKLSKSEEMVNKRIMERYIESGGKYYTISTSPAAIATELEWGKEAIITLKNNNVYIDCNFDQNNNRWTICIEEKISSYPSWVIGDKTITGIITPKTIAHMVNINMKELKEEVLSLIHPDDKKEIEEKISDFSEELKEDIIMEDKYTNDMNNNILLDENRINNNDLDNEIERLNEKKDDLNKKRNNRSIKRNKKREKKMNDNEDLKNISSNNDKDNNEDSENNDIDNNNNNMSENDLIENMYEQPSFRGMSILNKLDAQDKNFNEKNVDLLVENDDSSGLNKVDNMELPSKKEFEEFSKNIDSKNQALIKENQDLQQEADNKIKIIDEEDNNDLENNSKIQKKSIDKKKESSIQKEDSFKSNQENVITDNVVSEMINSDEDNSS